MSNIFRIHLKPGGDAGDIQQRKGLIAYCLEHNIFGFGWMAEGAEIDGTINGAEFDILYNLMDRGGKKAMNALRRCGVGSFIWTRDMNGIYYLGKVTGEYTYSSAPVGGYDLHHYRTVDKWHNMGSNAPGKIISCFAPPATIQRVYSQPMEQYCQAVCNGCEIEIAKEDLLSYLDPFDAEDAVALYLQAKRGYLLIPSSVAHGSTTVKYEYELIHSATGRHAVVQVKTGDDWCPCSDYAELLKTSDVILFFQNQYYDEPDTPGIVCLTNTELCNFLAAPENRPLLPAAIRLWVDFVK